MELADARSLSPEIQQALRQRAVAAVVEQGRTQQQVARELGVARATVKRCTQRLTVARATPNSRATCCWVRTCSTTVATARWRRAC